MMNRYDALGMELTSDYSKRVSLFSVRVVFQFIGYAVPNAVGLVLSNIFPTNIIAVYAYTALVLGATSLAGLLLVAGGTLILGATRGRRRLARRSARPRLRGERATRGEDGTRERGAFVTGCAGPPTIPSPSFFSLA